MQTSNPIHGVYDYRLVAISVLIAVITSYTALNLAGRVTATRRFARIAWVTGGALAMGTGIWSMHYTGMLAYGLPVPVYYHVPTVGLSLLAAIAASFIALYVVGRERMNVSHVIAGSVLMGTGIATMHYTGMAAMRMAAMHIYSPGMVALSIVLAIVISLVGLLLIFYSLDEKRGWKLKVAIAVAMGLAIPVMHYTGMAAVSFMVTGIAPDTSRSVGISGIATIAVTIVTCLILGFALITSLVDRRFSAQHVLLQRERTMLRALIDNIPEFMYVKDCDGRFVVANSWVARGAGFDDPEKLLGKNDFDLFPPEIAEAFHEDEQRLLRSGEPLFNREEEYIDSAGHTLQILTTKVPLRDQMGRVTGFAGIGRDVSERKRSDDALREAESKYRGIFHEAIVGIFQLAPSGQFLHVNPAMARIFAYGAPEEMIASLNLTAPECHADVARRNEFLAALQDLGSVKNFECQVIRKDDSRIWVSLNVHTIYRDGIPLRLEGMCEDISERKHLRDQLLQAQKLESVGQLAAGIAHEINTPIQYIEHNLHFLRDALNDLTTLLGHYERLLTDADASAPNREIVKEVKSAVDASDAGFLLEEIPKTLDQMFDGVSRVSTLVKAMKEFSHPGKKEKVLLDLNHAIENTIIVARNEWKYIANMETSLDPDLPAVRCQPGEFNQVILILIVNAAHAIAEVGAQNGAAMGRISVHTRRSEDWAEIRVQDNGSGIPEKVRPRIFDPFFTTKEIGKGTGQGLAIARSVIVEKHAGSIEFETETGKGTTFIVRIPIDGRAVTAEAVAA